ncbi:MAG: hypothetical protein WCI41_00535 [bacterium]
MNQEINKTEDLNTLVQEFETKSVNDEMFKTQNKEPENKKLTGKIIKYSGKLIKNEKEANYIILLFVILTFALSIFIFLDGQTPKQKAIITNPELHRKIQEQLLLKRSIVNK